MMNNNITIMTIEELFNIYWSVCDQHCEVVHNLPYYVYGIVDADQSTMTNLKVIDMDWYKELHLPVMADQHWEVNGFELFGGQLDYVYREKGKYYFTWHMSNIGGYYSSASSHWGEMVDGSTCVAVVHK